MTKRVWVEYRPLRYHSELVYRDAEGEVYFGGACPLGTCDTIRVGQEHIPKRHERLLVLEPPIVEPNCHDDGYLAQWNTVYTFGYSGLSNVVHYKMGIPPLWDPLGEVNLRPWAERKDRLVCVTGNKYPERLTILKEVARQAKKYGLGFDVYGRPGFAEPWYRGEVQGQGNAKRLLLSQYRYCLALENTTHLDRYLTEKLLDGLVSGCFCLYHGGSAAKKSRYPQIPWWWVATNLGLWSPTKRPESHVEYLDEISRAMPAIRKATSLDPLWQRILRDTNE